MLTGYNDLYFRPYQFRMEEIEAFRYRSQDAWKAVTRIAVREARLAEIKSEMMQSKKLRVGRIVVGFGFLGNW